MPAGRKTKPTKLKRNEGNPGKRPLPNKEPSAGSTVTKPETLNERSSLIWDKLESWLSKMELLDAADEIAMMIFCQSVDAYLTAQEFIDKNGSYYTTPTPTGGTMLRPVPQVAQRNQALIEIKAHYAEFGLTPASRSRLGTREQEEDPLAELMGAFQRNPVKN